MSGIVFGFFFNKKVLLLTLILLFGYFMMENAFSRENWNRTFMGLNIDPTDNAVIINFKFFDYFFGPGDENGYLSCCDFSYSTDGETFTHLFRVETSDQEDAPWTWLTMRYKRRGADLQLLKCYKPSNGTMWPDNDNDLRVELYNTTSLCGRIVNEAFLTVKWFRNTPGTDYKNAKYIRIKGFWRVNGVYKGDQIDHIYDIPLVPFRTFSLKNSSSTLKSEENIVENSTVNVFTEADAVVVKAATIGENVKVFNASGAEVKSAVINNNEVKIKPPKNQIYIVNVGQARYKVAL